MKNKKLLFLIIIAISVLFILSGCSNDDASISLSLSPNPINFYENQPEQELELTVKTEGLGSLSLDNLIIEVIDQNDETIFDEEKSIDISASVIVGGFSDSVKYTLNLEDIYNEGDYDSYDTFSDFYSNVLAGYRHTLRITVTGSNNSTLTAQINYNE